MVNDYNKLIQRDLNHIWHPCSQMKDFEQCPPLIVHQAKGGYLETDRGLMIDAISSWWCKSLGHGHPEIQNAIQAQLNQFEHVISANTTHETIVALAERLTEITQKQHVFFASDGSCAVEIALKLALHAKQLQGESHRHEFIALKNGYHGETLGTLSVSDLGLYKAPFHQFGLSCHFLQNIPYVSSQLDPLWSDCEPYWSQSLNALNALKNQICAIIVEPIVQGAGGMRCYSADYLRKLADWAHEHDIYFIADEIMTGLGRTGKWLACDHAGIQADMVCLSKGLTSGTLPLSCVSIDHKIYELFYDDYTMGKSFLHSHTYSGNPLAVSAALATLNIMSRDNINQKAEALGQLMRSHFTEIANQTNKLSNIRSIGAWVAGDLDTPDQSSRVGFQFYQAALNQGAYIRPLGNTLYWFPPLNTDKTTIEKLSEATLQAIHQTYTRDL